MKTVMQNKPRISLELKTYKGKPTDMIVLTEVFRNTLQKMPANWAKRFSDALGLGKTIHVDVSIIATGRPRSLRQKRLREGGESK